MSSVNYSLPYNGRCQFPDVAIAEQPVALLNYL